MPHVVALQVASPVKDAGIFELQTSGCRIGAYDGHIKVHQVTVVGRGALRGTNPVSIVTGRARDFLLEMILVLGEAFVIENAVSTVAFITEFIRVAALLREVRRFVATGEQVRIVGSVRTFRPRGAVGTVTIAAVNKRRNGHRRFQAGHIAVDAWRGDRME